MVNFWALETVPPQFRARNLYKHNPQVTLMRTTPDECRRIGVWIAEKLNRCEGPVRFLVAENGMSALDVPGGPFFYPEANAALFDALQDGVHTSSERRILRLPHHINDPAFSDALVENFLEIIRE